jgi:hypothetical protein
LPSFRHIAAALTAFLLLFVGQATASSDDDAGDSQLKRLHVKEGYGSIEIDPDARKVKINEAVITIGSMEMTADQYTIYWKESIAGFSSINPEDIEKCIVKGNLKIVYEHSVVTAQELFYDSAEQTLVITGEPVLLESQGSIVDSPVFKFTNFTPEVVQTMFVRPQDAVNTF